MPTVYLPHGGGPWPYVDLGFDPAELASLSRYLEAVAADPPTRPQALLVISAHWEEPVATVMTSEKPPMLYDYYGFPEDSYKVQWPAPGSSSVAARVRALLSSAGIESAEDSARGFDHGTFVPLSLTYPNADVPTLQLSLKRGLDPAEHLQIGRALAPLRDEGVFIIGSGMSFHNMRGFRDRRLQPMAQTFDRWLERVTVLPQPERDTNLTAWAKAPAAREAHPREEHLLPLMVIAGAAGADLGTLSWRGTVGGMDVSGYRFG
jgi:aromatic ring-opening dioxygenase catalytic subunit (LigB family)